MGASRRQEGVGASRVLVLAYGPVAVAWLLGHRAINGLVGRRSHPPRATACRWDDATPFAPDAAYLYFSGFVLAQLAVVPMAVTDFGKDIAAGYLVQVVLSLAVYWTVPVRVQRPPLDPGRRSDRLLEWFHRLSPPHNAFPSMHASFGVFSGLWVATVTPWWVAGAVLVWASGVVAATVLTREHTLVDAAAGSVLGALCYLVAA